MTEFYQPTSLNEACALLTHYRERATVIAGGTDVMVSINREKLSPDIMIGINEIGLSYIEIEKDQLIIGATCTYADICRSKKVLQYAPLLTEICLQTGSRAIRNMGTLGGNVVNGSRAGDGSAGLIALNATVKLVSSNGERTMPIESFFTGLRKTAIQTGELLQEIMIPLNGLENRWGWYRLGLRRTDIRAIVSVAIMIPTKNDICQKSRIGMGSVASTPLFAKKASDMLEGHVLDELLIDAVANQAANEITPFDDYHASAWYRKKVAGVIVKRVLQKCLSQQGD